jgi:DNA primase
MKEQVRTRTDIAAVIGRYVGLKGRGQTMLGLCPFHKEKTPSFTVNPAKGVFYCFGCGKGGDVFHFLQEIEGIGFREALEMLAEEAGVRIETKQRGRGDGRFDDGGRFDDNAQSSPHAPNSTIQTPHTTKTELLSIHNEAAKFFYGNIKNHQQAVDYFRSRELKPETVKEFGLGYAPAGWSNLCDYLQGKGVSQSKIIECGLAVSKDGGAVYDRFRDRIIFPLHDLGGRVVAFAGRGLEADAQPKYLNSPETALYHKSRVLYGLHKARQGIRDTGRLLIVEGYMDYLTLYQNGIGNIAAVSGTAFTEEHAHLIKRFASRAVLVFDSDRAGLAAAQRAVFVLAPFNVEALILTLPAGDDPDTFVKREGAAAFLELSAAAKAGADFLIDKLVLEYGGSPHGKSKAADELIPYARALTDSIVRDDFLARLAQRLQVDRQHITERFRRGGPPRSSNGNYENYETAGSAAPGKRNVLGALEESFLRILLTAPELIVQAKQYISPKILTDALSANVYSIILDTYAQKGGLSALPDVVSNDSEIGRLISMLAVKPTPLENIEEELVQKIMLLQRKHLKARMAGLREKLKEGHEPEKGRLMEELKDCAEQLKELDLRE